MTSVAITAVRLGHIDDISAIHAESFDDPWDTGMIRRILAMPGAFGLVALHGAEPVTVGFSLSRVAADECELLSLGVSPSRRRTGIGRGLLVASMAQAYAAGASRFFLEVAETNAAARGLYATHGFVPVGRRPDYYELRGGGHEAAVTMRADLVHLASRLAIAGEQGA